MSIKLTPLERETLRRRKIERRINKIRNVCALAVVYGVVTTVIVAIYVVAGCEL